ncbi:hypothetical protein NW064_02340 [Mycoplasmopsis felis]|nr:hypothetical protein [Mycoplasmopsis felis]UWW01219.1 hypothetical protein NW064_02340 [Mycoplasmopsis felis]
MEVVKSALLQSLETENILKTSRIFGVDLIYKFLNKHTNLKISSIIQNN